MFLSRICLYLRSLQSRVPQAPPSHPTPNTKRICGPSCPPFIHEMQINKTININSLDTEHKKCHHENRMIEKSAIAKKAWSEKRCFFCPLKKWSQNDQNTWRIERSEKSREATPRFIFSECYDFKPTC